MKEVPPWGGEIHHLFHRKQESIFTEFLTLYAVERIEKIQCRRGSFKGGCDGISHLSLKCALTNRGCFLKRDAGKAVQYPLHAGKKRLTVCRCNRAIIPVRSPGHPSTLTDEIQNHAPVCQRALNYHFQSNSDQPVNLQYFLMSRYFNLPAIS